MKNIRLNIATIELAASIGENISSAAETSTMVDANVPLPEHDAPLYNRAERRAQAAKERLQNRRRKQTT